jgi:hypothetical protein
MPGSCCLLRKTLVFVFSWHLIEVTQLNTLAAPPGMLALPTQATWQHTSTQATWQVIAELIIAVS